MSLKFAALILVLVMMAGLPVSAEESEVLPKTKTQVMVREHPKTGRSYAVIVSSEKPDAGYPYHGKVIKASRPDYRMLDPKVKRGEIPYDGPYSDRRKIYYFAAGMATAGLLGGTLIPVAPAAAGAAGSGGGLGYGLAGTAVIDGTISTAMLKQRPDPNRDDFTHKSEAVLTEIHDAPKESSSGNS